MNEIVTYGQGYELNTGIQVFINSALKTGNSVIVLGYNLKKNAIEFINRSGGKYIDVEPIARKYNVDLNLSPYTLKVVFFYLYTKHISNADNLFLCDFTDIYFQSNIFEHVKDRVTVFGEGNAIMNCNTNTTWIQLCYNLDILGLLRQYEIINGGAILGNKQSCVGILKEMCADTAIILGKIGNYPNIDQAILNKVVRFDHFRYNVATAIPVLNMAHYNNKNKITVDSGRVVIHLDQFQTIKIPAVVHQYDVNKNIERFINEQG